MGEEGDRMSPAIQKGSGVVSGRIAIALLALLAAPAVVDAANPRAEAVLAQLPFSDAERKKILAGELVTTASKEKTSDRELAISMAFLINKPPSNLSEMFQKAASYDMEK